MGLQLAPKARENGHEDEPISDTDTDQEVVSENINSGAPLTELTQLDNKPAAPAAPAAAAAAAAAAATTAAAAAVVGSVVAAADQEELSLLSALPVHATLLKSSASLPSNLSNLGSLAPVFMPPAAQASFPERTGSQTMSLATTVSKSGNMALPERSHARQLSSSEAAGVGAPGGLQPAGGVPPVSCPKLAAASVASGIGITDSSMSNSPKESAASIAWRNPFQSRTNITYSSGQGSAVEAAVTGLKTATYGDLGTLSGPVSKQLGVVSKVADDKENCSPKRVAQRGSGYTPRVSQGSVSMTDQGSMGPPPSVLPAHTAGQTLGHSGTASALSGTASGHALSGNFGMRGGVHPREPHKWDVSQDSMREGGVCADTTVQGPGMTVDPGDVIASKRAKLSHGHD